jgi:hypothetical protein
MTYSVLILIFVVALAASTVGAEYFFRKWVLRAFLLIWIGLVLMFSYGPWHDFIYIEWLGFAALMWGTVAGIVIARHRRGGQIFFTFRQTQQYPKIFGININIVFLGFAGVQVILGLEQYLRGNLESVQQGFNSLCTAILSGSTGALLTIVPNIGNYLICENGLMLYYGAVIRWQQITSFQWHGDLQNQLSIQANSKLYTGFLSIPVPLEQKEAVDRLFKERIPDAARPRINQTVTAN